MIIAELGKLRTSQERKIELPKKLLPFRFKTFQQETSGHWTNIGRALTNRYHKFQEEEGRTITEKECKTLRAL